MPSDFRILLGFHGPDAVAKAADALGMVLLNLDMEVATDADDEDDLQLGFAAQDEPAIMDRLNAAYLAAVADLGGTATLIPLHHGYEAKVVLNGTTSTRCVPFSIELFYDEGEVGDEPQDKVLGIALDGRYRSVLLDIEAATSRPTRNLDQQADRIAIARARITEAFPVFKDAQLIAKDVFY